MIREKPDYLRALPDFVQAKLAEQCEGDWRRVTRGSDGSITVHNHPVEVEEPPAPEPPPAAPEMVREVLPPVRPRRELAPAPVSSGNGLRARGERLAEEQRFTLVPHADADDGDELRGAKTYVRVEATEKFRKGMYKGSTTELCQIIERDGFQGAIRYTDDILALEGMPWEDMESAIRNPHRVVVRPETGKKGYPVLALIRGDVQVIMGFFIRNSPAVIACYWTHLLGHDEGRFSKGAAGAGGGTRKEAGLPNTPGKVIRRLTEIGVEIPDVDTTTGNTAECFYDKQSLGRITIGNIYKKGQPQSDYQRIYRKVDAIVRRRASAR